MFYIETANAGQLITTITAKDLDSGKFGEQGLRYSLSGTGANLFHVDNVTGAITVGTCPPPDTEHNHARKRRQVLIDENDAKNVNLTLVGETGVIHVEPTTTDMTNNEFYKVFNSHDELLPSVEVSDVKKEVIHTMPPANEYKPGVAPCLDFEIQPVYYLSYKVSYIHYNI